MASPENLGVVGSIYELLSTFQDCLHLDTRGMRVSIFYLCALRYFTHSFPIFMYPSVPWRWEVIGFLVPPRFIPLLLNRGGEILYSGPLFLVTTYYSQRGAGEGALGNRAFTTEIMVQMIDRR